MTAVLVAPSTVACPHSPGLVAAATTSSRLTVGKMPVLLAGLTGKAVAGCTTAPSQNTKTCLTVASVTTGEKSRLTVGGVSVVLADVAGATDGVSPTGNALKATANQTRLTAAPAVL
ncbi:hypothetical protein AB0M02_34265 [Actinoplanes sp. NPDC051861]|uniref:hypothetical protein n=1 Tax=Actinoplanes sp. NPDC051861 TaxID=3155170 RepID=UPI003415BE47